MCQLPKKRVQEENLTLKSWPLSRKRWGSKKQNPSPTTMVYRPLETITREYTTSVLFQMVLNEDTNCYMAPSYSPVGKAWNSLMTGSSPPTLYPQPQDNLCLWDPGLDNFTIRWAERPSQGQVRSCGRRFASQKGKVQRRPQGREIPCCPMCCIFLIKNQSFWYHVLSMIFFFF